MRKPTGIIERLFGHSVYRMDVSGRIGEGRSWQLGALIAHALKAEDRLAGKDDTPDHILWITGEVNSELTVHPVEHVAEKLAQSTALFESAVEWQCPLTLVVPAVCGEEIDPENLAGQVDLVAAENAAELFEKIDLKPLSSRQPIGNGPSTTEHPSNPTSLQRGKRIPWLVAGGVAAAAIAAVAAGMALHKAPGEKPEVILKKASKADTPVVVTEPTVKLIELRPPPGSNCAAIRFGNADPVEVALTPTAMGYHSTHLDELCGVAFSMKGFITPG